MEEENNKTKNTEAGGEKTPVKKEKIIISVLVVVILALTAFIFYLKITGKNNPIGQSLNEIGNSSPQEAAEVVTNNPIPTEEPSGSESLGTGLTVPVSVDTEEKISDLYIAKYSFSKDPEKGKEFEVRITIGNKGNGSAGNFHWEWWPTSSGKGCDGKVYGLAPGKTQIVECDYTYGGWANYTTKAVADSENEIDESNEGNNVATKQVVPIHDEKADLYITNYSFNHDPKMGEEFTVSITIKNKGEGDADDFFWEWWPTAFGKACRDKIGGLDAGESKTVKCDYTYGGWANYVTKAVADADDDVSESNEGNNISSKNVIPIH